MSTHKRGLIPLTLKYAWSVPLLFIYLPLVPMRRMGTQCGMRRIHSPLESDCPVYLALDATHPGWVCPLLSVVES